MSSELSDQTEVWRYMDLWKFLSLLETESLYFSRLDTLEDPFDGQLRPYEEPYARKRILAELEASEGIPEVTEDRCTSLVRQGATDRFGPIYVSCWHVAKHSSYAMWKLYCPSGQGVALVSDLGRLRALAEEEQHLTVRKVSYQSVRRLGRVDAWDELAFLKRREYDFEREVRMVVRHPLLEYVRSGVDTPGHRVPIVISSFIKKIWIPAGGLEWQQTALKSTLEKLGLKVEVGRSKLLENYWGDEAKIGNAMLINQLGQLNNPDGRIVLGAEREGASLEKYADGLAGTQTGDYPRYGRQFWELVSFGKRWLLQQSTGDLTQPYFGRELAMAWEEVNLAAKRGDGAYVRGLQALGKPGVVISPMGQLPACLYGGQIYDNNTSTVIPKDSEHLPAIWCFCSSPEFNKAVRAIDQSLKVTNATLVQVPFDLDRWQKVADERYPDGLPEPHSDDPTQWLFRGDIPSSTDPLQVAVARLLNYRWPDPLDEEFSHLLDADGIVTLAPLVNQEGLTNRLRALLQAAYQSPAPQRPKGAPEVEEPRVWDEITLPRLLARAGSPGMSLEDWLRDKFFESHCKLFHQRPFLWHIWDGRKDGFHAIVNYHKLDGRNLDRLTHVYLGEWIERQKAASDSGDRTADARIVSAQELQKKLELIRTGEPPYDIFVRWKSLAEQPMGWNPDLNDGVRMNIRPFVEAGILRGKVNVNWNKDRGKDPKPNVSGTVERHNDLHFTLAEKQTAREAKS